MQQTIVVNILAPHHPQILSKVTKLAAISRCKVQKSQAQELGQQQTLALLLQGSWSEIARFEAGLAPLENEFALNVTISRTKNLSTDAILPYTIQVIAKSSSELLYNICSYLASQKITIQKLTQENYQGYGTNNQMTILNLHVGVPDSAHLAGVREDFFSFCDELNYDAILEPHYR